MKRAVIFDLDGTLSDSIASIKYCGDAALEPFGFGPFGVEQYKYFVGDGAANLVRRALAAAGDVELVHFDQAFARYREIFRENCMYQVKPYEGIPELLAALRGEGKKTAVLSNKPHMETVRVIETLFGRDCFDMVLGQQEGMALKPSPEGVFRILGQITDIQPPAPDHSSLIRLFQACNNFQQSRLARAVDSNKAYLLPFAHGKGSIIKKKPLCI